MVVIYSPNQSDRLTYVLDEIFTHRLGLGYTLTSDAQEYAQQNETIKINYSNEDLSGYCINPSKILFERGLNHKHKPEAAKIQNIEVLFPQPTSLGFDIFAMCFWYLSRYEEYYFVSHDKHDRFTVDNAKDSSPISPELPVLDIALNFFYTQIGLKTIQKYAIYPTLDIDMAFKYKGKPLLIHLAGFFRDLFLLRFDECKTRISVALGAHDPWDTFDHIHNWLNTHKERVRIFIHSGTRGPYDKMVSINHTEYKKKIQKLNEQFELGLHPSYASFLNLKKLQEEKNNLEQIANKIINRSRQHYLKMKLPETYNQLSQAGILHDYTMGFPNGLGFRAGTGHSFRYYNFQIEKTSELIIHPFCMMDVTLKNYMQLTPKMAIEKIAFLKAICKQEGVPFTFIFHNESLSERGDWKGWTQVFHKCLE